MARWVASASDDFQPQVQKVHMDGYEIAIQRQLRRITLLHFVILLVPRVV